MQQKTLTSTPKKLDALRHVCASAGLAAATQCDAGTYNPLTGQSDPAACVTCPVGSYCPDAGMDDAL